MANQTSKRTIIAKVSHALSSPRKTNLILKAITGRPAMLAIKQLSVNTKRASRPVVKLIQQAVGNAVSQHHASPDELIIDTAYATKGRTLKRAHIGGRGRTKPYERITSHLTLHLRLPSAHSPLATATTQSKITKNSTSEEVPASAKGSVNKRVAKTTKKAK